MSSKLSIKYLATYRHAEFYMERLSDANSRYSEGGKDFNEGVRSFDVHIDQIKKGFKWTVLNQKSHPKTSIICFNYVFLGDLLLRFRLEARELVNWAEAANLHTLLYDDRQQAWSLNYLGNAYRKLGDLSKALEFHLEGLRISKKAGNKTEIGNALCYIGVVYHEKQNFKKSIEYLVNSLDFAIKAEDLRWKSYRLGMIGNSLSNYGKPKKSIEFTQKALDISLSIGDRRAAATYHMHLSSALKDVGLFTDAIRNMLEAISINREIDFRWGIAANLSGLGNIYMKIKDNNAAYKCYKEALTYAEANGSKKLEIICLTGLANLCEWPRQKTQIFDYFKKALQIATSINNYNALSIIHGKIGESYMKINAYDSAKSHYEDALRYSRRLKIDRRICVNLSRLADSYFALQLPKRAYNLYHQSLNIAEEINYNIMIKIVNDKLVSSFDEK